MAQDFYTCIKARGGFAGEYEALSEAEFATAASGAYVPGEPGIFRIVAARTAQLLQDSPVYIEGFQASDATIRVPSGSLPTLIDSDAGDGRFYFVKSSDTAVGTLTIEDSSGTSIAVLEPGDFAIIVHGESDSWDIAVDTVFTPGDNFNTNEETTAIITTTAGLFVNHNTLTLTDIPAGQYKIDYFYVWSHDSQANDFLARVRVIDGGTTELINPSDTAIHRQEPKDAGGAGTGGTNQRYLISGHRILTLPSVVSPATITVELDFATDSGGVESTIYHSIISVSRVAL